MEHQCMTQIGEFIQRVVAKIEKEPHRDSVMIRLEISEPIFASLDLTAEITPAVPSFSDHAAPKLRFKRIWLEHRMVSSLPPAAENRISSPAGCQRADGHQRALVT